MGKTKEILKKDKNGKTVAVFSNGLLASIDGEISKTKLYTAIRRHKEINGFYYEYSGKYTNGKQIYENGFKCPYCSEILKNYNSLAKHIMYSHNEISKEQLLTDYYYNGIRPTCKCGCNNYTNIIYDRNNNNQIKFADYCKGHQSRVHNNWGHNLKAKENSAKTRREQYNSGERKQWNKGKTWDETYTKIEQKGLLNALQSKERRLKISRSNKGKPKPEEYVIKMRERLRTPEMREFYRKQLHNKISNGKFSLTSQLERDFIDEFIKPFNLDYITQYYIKDIHQYCDLYIPSKNIIIEVDGSHWHADPRLFPDGPKFDYQEKRIKLDEQKNEYCKHKNIKILRFWEIDIKKHPEEIIETLNRELTANKTSREYLF